MAFCLRLVGGHCLPVALVLFNDLLVVLADDLDASDGLSATADETPAIDLQNALDTNADKLTVLNKAIEKHWHD